MNLHKLEIYCKVVEEGSVTAAAEHFHVTQPVVSSHLRDLEVFFGAKLLHVEKRRMLVTEPGQASTTTHCPSAMRRRQRAASHPRWTRAMRVAS